jgi:hypothetical protein
MESGLSVSTAVIDSMGGAEMARVCTVCSHKKKREIDETLVSGSGTISGIARTFRVSEDAVFRHLKKHLPATLVQSAKGRELARAETLADSVSEAEGRAGRLYQAAESILERALGEQDSKTALTAIGSAVSVMREARGLMELRGELTGELSAPPQMAMMSQVIVLPSFAAEEIVSAIETTAIDTSLEATEDTPRSTQSFGQRPQQGRECI